MGLGRSKMMYNQRLMSPNYPYGRLGGPGYGYSPYDSFNGLGGPNFGLSPYDTYSGLGGPGLGMSPYDTYSGLGGPGLGMSPYDTYSGLGVQSWDGNCKIIHGRSRHSQGQGLVEQGNGTLKRMIASMMSQFNTNNWLIIVENLEKEKDFVFEEQIEPVNEPVGVEQVKNVRVRTLRECVKQNQEKAAAKMIEKHRKKRNKRNLEFNIGDKISVRIPRIYKGGTDLSRLPGVIGRISHEFNEISTVYGILQDCLRA
ncbi:unnamed protein product [Brachionus calyciflorus]|uniref:Integrase catalytic domain-containing protein n=1 Tax=Brachionus calyciflorus TaxID=104777 RepID=A0A814C683_9BILA|nr:unnamed protein product [Brachionus calyciflorus]